MQVGLRDLFKHMIDDSLTLIIHTTGWAKIKRRQPSFIYFQAMAAEFLKGGKFAYFTGNLKARTLSTWRTWPAP